MKILDIGHLTPSQQRKIVGAVKAFATAAERRRNPASDLVSEAFMDEFTDRLTMYQYFNHEPMSKKAFEYALVAASNAAGRPAFVNTKSTDPAQDVVISGQNFSCKTEAALGISRVKLTISKLMEARWIRPCMTGEDFQAGVRRHVLAHLGKYERMIILRAYRNLPSVDYDLLELPLDLLRRVGDLEASAYGPRGAKSGGCSTEITIDGQRAFTLVLDGSVEKVTIRDLLVRRCIIHASWRVRLSDDELSDPGEFQLSAPTSS